MLLQLQTETLSDITLPYCISQGELGGLPEAVRPAARGGEFMVSADRVRRRPLTFYVGALANMQVNKTNRKCTCTCSC